jgi:multidrug efflux pump subunit AcrB
VNSFFRFFVERHMLAKLFTIMVILLGIGTLVQIKRDVFPDVDFGQMIITTYYPGASPEDVELNVTNEIEEELKSVSNLDRITSYSMENLSVVTVEIDVNADDKDRTKQDVREAVNRVTDLPDEVTEAPLVTEISSAIVPVIDVGISGDLPYRRLREVARLFKKKLENVPGVSSVNEFWYLDREVKVEIDPEALERFQIPLQDITRAIRERNIRATGGTFESYTSERSVVTLAQFENPEDVNEVIVRSTFSGPPLRVKDVGGVRDAFEEPRIISRMNGMPAITFQVLKMESADIIRTVDAVKKLAEKEQQLLPDGVEIRFADDVSYYVRNRFNVVLSNGAIGLALVLIVLSVFLNLRTAFWVALSIPVVLLGVLFLLPVMGAYLDIIALTAMLLVIGIVVDDGIIVSENIVRRRELGDPPLQAAANGIHEVAKPVITTIVTTFLAFAPMFFMSGVTGEFVFVIPLVISLAVLISVAEVTVALPAHLVPGLAKQKQAAAGGRKWFDAIRRLFQKYIYYALKLRYGFIVLSIGLLAGSLWYAANHMQFILFPATAADNINAYLETPVGSSLEHTSEKAKAVEQAIARLPENELASFTTRVGSHGERQPGEYENWALIRINLTPYAKRDRTAGAVADELRAATDSIPGLARIVYDVEAGGPPVGDPVTVRIVGSDDQMRRRLTDSLIAFIGAIDGVTDMDRNDKLGKQQVRIKLDYDKLSRLGLSVAAVAGTARIAFDGDVVTSVRYGDEDVDFRVILKPSARSSLDNLRELLIPNEQGRLIALKDVASLEKAPGPANYYHFDRERTTTVTADIVEGKTTPLEVTGAALKHFDLDRDWPGMRFVIGGEAEETASSFRSLFIAFGIAVIAIFFVLSLLFDSFSQPFMVMVAIPFGIVAVIIAFALHGEPLGFLALMGLVGLSGVVVNDSLVMVNHINELRKNYPGKRIIEVVSMGTANRLRAVIMTALTTAAGLIPLAYGIGGSDPFIAPMALALGYGLLFATPLTLVFVPCLYVVRADILQLVRSILPGKE